MFILECDNGSSEREDVERFLVAAGRNEGRNETKGEAVRNIMEALTFTAEQAMDTLKIPEA